MKESLSIIPQPRSLTFTRGEWSSGPTLGISCDNRLSAQAGLLAHYLQAENQVTPRIVTPGSGAIHLSLTLSPRLLSATQATAGLTDEAHRITVSPDSIRIEGATPAGVALGLQSLRQLLAGQKSTLCLPGLVIDDYPEMAWRGLHLDVSRHFFDAAEVRRFIDLAAYHKFNLFHWHLTDDQGWRLPVEGYPRLTSVAAWRDTSIIGHQDHAALANYDGKRHGGFYTHEEIRGVVEYAATRGVHILPEVDLPGHAQALVAAYPEFGNASVPPSVRTCWGISPTTLNLEPGTFLFIDALLATIADLFPFHYIHLGGDEARTDEWAASPRIQERKRELGLANEHAVQGYFTRCAQEAAARHGRAMIGWDEIIADNEPPGDVAIMFWRDGGYNLVPPPHLKALQHGHPVVLAPQSTTYFDYYQAEGGMAEGEPLAIFGFTPWERVYAWNPWADIPAELRPGILGAQAQLWTEYIPTPAHLDYMTYPRASALAQLLWTGADRETLEHFQSRLNHHLPRLDRLGVAYRPLSAKP